MSGGGDDDPTEQSGGFGAIDLGSLRDISGVSTEMEPLVETASLDDPFDPGVLTVDLADGIGTAATARFDVRWSLLGTYTFHYTDAVDVDFRFDRRPKPGAPNARFHRPPGAESDDVEPSCITGTEPTLVDRAVLKLWRGAYERGTAAGINEGEEPP